MKNNSLSISHKNMIAPVHSDSRQYQESLNSSGKDERQFSFTVNNNKKDNILANIQKNPIKPTRHFSKVEVNEKDENQQLPSKKLSFQNYKFKPLGEQSQVSSR